MGSLKDFATIGDFTAKAPLQALLIFFFYFCKMEWRLGKTLVCCLSLSKDCLFAGRCWRRCVRYLYYYAIVFCTLVNGLLFVLGFYISALVDSFGDHLFSWLMGVSALGKTGLLQRIFCFKGSAARQLRPGPVIECDRRKCVAWQHFVCIQSSF